MAVDKLKEEMEKDQLLAAAKESLAKLMADPVRHAQVVKDAHDEQKRRRKQVNLLGNNKVIVGNFEIKEAVMGTSIASRSPSVTPNT